MLIGEGEQGTLYCQEGQKDGSSRACASTDDTRSG